MSKRQFLPSLVPSTLIKWSIPPSRIILQNKPNLLSFSLLFPPTFFYGHWQKISSFALFPLEVRILPKGVKGSFISYITTFHSLPRYLSSSVFLLRRLLFPSYGEGQRDLSAPGGSCARPLPKELPPPGSLGQVWFLASNSILLSFSGLGI